MHFQGLLVLLVWLVLLSFSYFIHSTLCRKFDTEPLKIRSIVFYLYLASISFGYFPISKNFPEFLLIIFGWSIVLIDSKHHRIPNVISGYLSILLLVVAFVSGNISDSMIGGCKFLLFFGVLCLISKQSIGIGDVKLAVVIGLAIGSVSFLAIIKFAVVASILGLVSIFCYPARVRFKAKIPFAAPMIAASIWIWPMLHMKG